jgi:hypothetical protein
MNYLPMEDDEIERLIREGEGTFVAGDAVRQSMRSRLAPRASLRAHRLRVFVPTATAAVLMLTATVWMLTTNVTAPSAYAQLMEVLDQAKTSKWLHLKAKDGAREVWVAYQPYRDFMRDKNGIIDAHDSAANRALHFDPATRTLTVRADYMPDAMARPQSHFDGITTELEWYKSLGSALSLEDHDALRTISVKDPKREDRWLRMVFERSSKRLIMMECSNWVDGQPGQIEYEVKYAEAGPKDIYEFGVPLDAIVVNRVPTERLLQTRDRIDKATKAFAPMYYALVVTDNVLGEHGRRVDAESIYKRNGRFRVDIRRVSLAGNKIGTDESGRPLPLDDIQALERWVKTLWLHEVQFLDENSVWTRVQDGAKKGEPLDVVSAILSSTPSVESYTWDSGLFFIDQTSLLEDEKTAKELLIGTRHSFNGSAPRGDEVPTYPQQFKNYFNPKRDYLCEYLERVTTASGRWSDSAIERDVEIPKEADPAFSSVVTRSVVEAAQTPRGQWYAKRLIQEESTGSPPSLQSKSYIWILLDTTREPPEDLFDPDKVHPAEFVKP